MTTIAVLGANGQVGSEVSLLLSVMSGVSVVPVVRSELGATLLERCGLRCRIGSTATAEETARLLEGADLVADFRSYGGLPAEMRRAARLGIQQCIDRMPAGSRYVYMSSTMAYGMPEGAQPTYGWHVVARSSYATRKRDAERFARWYGRLRRRPPYVLRLGQVFGELQAVSRVWLDSVRQGPLALPEAGNVPSDVVFCSTIALALQNIAAGKERPGTYTLVESPDWRWREVYAMHASEAGVAGQLVSAPAPAGRLARLRAKVRAAIPQDLLVAHLLPPSLGLQRIIKARHLKGLAASQIGAAERAVATIVPFAGPVPGRRLATLAGSWSAMRPQALAVRKLLDERLGPRSHNYGARLHDAP